ncbi:hypothetical protein ACFL5Z_12170, partial [Planctomycetota bacterium]
HFDSGFDQVLITQFTFVNIDPLYSRPYTQASMPPVMVNPTWHFINQSPLRSRHVDNRITVDYEHLGEVQPFFHFVNKTPHVSQVFNNRFAFEGALYGAERDIGVVKDSSIGPRTHRDDGPDLSEYCPHILWHIDEPFVIEKYAWYVLPATEAIKHGLGRGLTSMDCSAICYWFQWNGETDYNFQGLDKKPDKEPVVIYVSGSDKVLGMQTRIHHQWQDMKPVGKDDLFNGKHLVVFFGNIGYELLGQGSPHIPVFTHTPILGRKAVECVKRLGKSRKTYEMGTDYKGKLQRVTMMDFPLKALPLSDNESGPSIPKRVTEEDVDVLAATNLCANAPRGQVGELVAYKSRRSVFLKVHFHLGRIEMRRLATNATGKVDEKERRLEKAIQRWASKMDTHSTAESKPTMETILVLEPSEERFARLLAEAYATEISTIRTQLKSLHRQIVLDAERLWPPAERKDEMLALISDAQEQEDKGRISLGGKGQIDDLGRLLGRTLVPVLLQLGRGPTAANPTEAAAKLAEAVSKALSKEVERQIPGRIPAEVILEH